MFYCLSHSLIECKNKKKYEKCSLKKQFRFLILKMVRRAKKTFERLGLSAFAKFLFHYSSSHKEIFYILKGLANPKKNVYAFRSSIFCTSMHINIPFLSI